MPIIRDEDRQVIPRWRLFEETAKRGELGTVDRTAAPEKDPQELRERLLDWKHSPSISVAADLVSTAITLGIPETAQDASEYILSHASSDRALRSLANFAITGEYVDDSILLIPQEYGRVEMQRLPPSSFCDPSLVLSVRQTRRNLERHPRNPIQWCNLALLHTSAGQFEKAERAMSAAFSMGSENRFILRAASRFHLHMGDKDRARRILTNSHLVKKDPWIMAAEIATSDAVHRSSRLINSARKILRSGDFSEFHTSELASALGTIEMKAGKRKSGTKLITMSLTAPTENSIAQAAWVGRRITSQLEILPIAQSPEAEAWRAGEAEQWDLALKEGEKWLSDQPFSSRPAVYVSFLLASVFQSYKQALQLAGRALLSNSEDALLLNNSCFAAAHLGEIELAFRLLKRLAASKLSNQDRIMAMATAGFVQYRSGNPIAGRAFYEQAIHESKLIFADSLEAHAMCNLGLEEARILSPDAITLCQKALDKVNGTDFMLRSVCAERLKEALSANSSTIILPNSENPRLPHSNIAY